MAVGTLTVNVAARTGPALQNLSKFRKGVSSTTSRIKKLGKGLATLKGGFGVLAGLAGVGLSFRGLKRVADDLDRLAKTGARLGEDPGRLQALARGAQLAGVETGQLTKAIEAMTRRVSEAAMGQGEAVSALETLGLSARRLNRINPAEQLREIADGMAGLDVQADRVRVSMDLFSRSAGAQMVNFLQNGSAAIDEATKRFDRFGRRFSRQELARVEQFGDRWDDLGTAFQSLAQVAVLELTPALKEAADSMARFVESGDASRGLTALADTVGAVGFAFNQWNRGMGFWRGAIREGMVRSDAFLSNRGLPTLLPGGPILESDFNEPGASPRLRGRQAGAEFMEDRGWRRDLREMNQKMTPQHMIPRG